MQEEWLPIQAEEVWVLWDLPEGKWVIGINGVFRKTQGENERVTIIRTKATPSCTGYRQEEVDVTRVHLNMATSQKKCMSNSLQSSMVKDFEDLMAKKEFKMVPWGELTFFFGLSSQQSNGEKDEKGEDVGYFKSLQRFRMYMLFKRIFRYLKHQPKLGLWYPKDSPFHLEAFSDSDYVGDNHDRRSTSGGCQYLGRRLVSWQCKKQTIVAISYTEEEYVAAASCCAQVLWMQNQLLDYGFNFMNTEIYIDNESTICIVKNPVFHSKTKHIQIRHHFIRDCYEQRLINVVKVHTDDNIADLLTKGFELARFNFLVVTIGMMNP
ncbi:hypothetical protein Tco_0999004 [Tanacetum coccineum]